MHKKIKAFIQPTILYSLLSVGVALFYWCSRLINLTIIPIFTDEAIYLRWGQIADSDPRWRFISLIDGKQPLLIWLFLPAFKLISDPLVAGRIVSVIAGFVGMTGLMIFSYILLRSKKAVLIAGLLYILMPFFVVYDRLAIYDALLAAISIWSLLFTYLLAKTLRLDVALILGTIIGAGLLTKSSALFFLLLLPVTLLLMNWKMKRKLTQFLTWAGVVLAVLVQSQIYNSILLLSEFRHNIGLKNLQFIYSFSEFMVSPLVHTGGNLRGLTTWLVTYFTWPFAVLVVISVVWHIRTRWREGLFFLSFFAIPYLALAFFGKIIYPRFLLFMLPPLLISVILFTHHLLSHKHLSKITFVIIGIIAIPLVLFDYALLTDPVHAPLPLADRQQFINDWPAGYGIAEVVSYLKEEAKKGPIVIGTDGTFGLYPMALELYLGTDRNVSFKPYWPLNEFPPDLLADAKTKPTFLLFKERQDYPSDWPIVLINQYQRGDGPTYLKFFRVVPKT